MPEPLRITQVLLLADVRRSLDVAAPLWSALHEAASFYSPYRPVDAERFSVGDVPCPAIESELTSQQRQAADLVSVDGLRKLARGPFSRIDQARVAREVTRALQSAKRNRCVIVTDFDITPPRDWRYVIWDDLSDAVVVSTAPVDPRYWRMPEDNRAALLKHRVRSACLSIIGRWVGLKHCDNETCFLYGNVDAATTLDAMVLLGPEHEIPELASKGFTPLENQPSRIQMRIDKPPFDTFLA